MQANHTLGDVLHGFLEAQDAVRRATVSVERVACPGIPGLSKYTLYGHSKGAVQECISARMREAENAEHGGFAQFLTPSLARDGRWTSRGEVMIYPAPTQVVA